MGIEIGDWYWVKDDDDEYLMCVDELGSNFVGFTVFRGYYSSGCRIHFDDFEATCRPEPAWREYFKGEMLRLQKAIEDKIKLLVDDGQKLMLLPSPKEEKKKEDKDKVLLPAKVTDAPKRYKKQLLKLRDKTLPSINKEVDELAEDFAVAAKNMTLPDLARLGRVKEVLGSINDKIFTIEIYCGLQEEIHQIAKGKPCPPDTKISVRQTMLFMDEETLFDYRSGGMDFKSLEKFDKWVVKKKNINRILPEQKGIVALRVRRHKKDYGTPSSIAQAFAQIQMDSYNLETYILIRNGGNVYRIASSIDFSPRLIPLKDEIGPEQFIKKAHWSGEKDEVITKADVRYDDHVKKQDQLMNHYNRMVVLIQGLLDRSKTFHPHNGINLLHQGSMEKWVNLIRDEENILPSSALSWFEYRDQLNGTLKKGKMVFVKFPAYSRGKYDTRYRYWDEEDKKERYRPLHGEYSNRMPDINVVQSIRRDRSAVKVSWPKGHKREPGWYGFSEKSDQTCHEWIPMKYVINVTDYNLGDYKMFLCNRSLKGEYLKWAPFLLSAENWARKKAKAKTR